MDIKFTRKEYDFIAEGFGHTKEQVDEMSMDELYDLADECFGIEEEEEEEEEIVAAGEDGELSERGELAAPIVTKVNKQTGKNI